MVYDLSQSCTLEQEAVRAPGGMLVPGLARVVRSMRNGRQPRPPWRAKARVPR